MGPSVYLFVRLLNKSRSWTFPSVFCSYTGTAERPPTQTGSGLVVSVKGPATPLHTQDSADTQACNFRWTLCNSTSPAPADVLCVSGNNLVALLLGLVQHVFIPGAMMGSTKYVLGKLIEGCLSHPMSWFHVKWMVWYSGLSQEVSPFVWDFNWNYLIDSVGQCEKSNSM